MSAVSGGQTLHSVMGKSPQEFTIITNEGNFYDAIITADGEAMVKKWEWKEWDEEAAKAYRERIMQMVAAQRAGQQANTNIVMPQKPGLVRA